jgi:thioredoxin 1
MATVKLTKKNFKKTIEDNNFVIVDFWAPWCEPCIEFTPLIEAASEKNKDILFGMVDIEADPEIGEYFQVDKIPGLLIIREQAGIHTQIGQIGVSALDEIIKWAREHDMSTVRDYYDREAKGEIKVAREK